MHKLSCGFVRQGVEQCDGKAAAFDQQARLAEGWAGVLGGKETQSVDVAGEGKAGVFQEYKLDSMDAKKTGKNRRLKWTDAGLVGRGQVGAPVSLTRSHDSCQLGKLGAAGREKSGQVEGAIAAVHCPDDLGWLGAGDAKLQSEWSRAMEGIDPGLVSALGLRGGGRESREQELGALRLRGGRIVEPWMHKWCVRARVCLCVPSSIYLFVCVGGLCLCVCARAWVSVPVSAHAFERFSWKSLCPLGL